MTCYLASHAWFNHPRKENNNNNTQILPFISLVPVVPSKINDKFRVANSFIQLVSNFRTVNMKKLKCKHCPVPGCGSKFLVRLANHLAQVHDFLSEIKRKYWLQFAKLQNTNAIRVYYKEGEPKTVFQ